MLRVISYALSKFDDLSSRVSLEAIPTTITGFDGAVSSLLRVGRALEQEGKLLFIFLDQFENIFFLPDTLRRIRDLLFSICDASQSALLLGNLMWEKLPTLF